MDYLVSYNLPRRMRSKLTTRPHQDDAGNLCHSGFLRVARQMITPVAERLRALLQENPSRCKYTLLITGHSAGGAVAQLLFAHMLSANVASELSRLTGSFKRVHCVTFGAPPVSLLPLQKPEGARYVKNMFFSFINEGDPVPRADRAVVGSLLRLYVSPAPGTSCVSNFAQLALATPVRKDMNHSAKMMSPLAKSSPTIPRHVWNVPPSTLSCAGRLVLLRHKPGTVGKDNVEACVVTDEQLRGVIFGDPVCHMMKLYEDRIETLATRAVTGRTHG